MLEDTQNIGSTASDTEATATAAVTPHVTPQVPHKPSLPATATSPTVAVAPVVVTPLPDTVPAQPVSTEVKKSIAEQIVELEALLPGLEAQRFDVEEKSKGFFSKRKDLEDVLSPILLKENASLIRVHEIGEEEKSAMSPSERRILDKLRWDVEEERRNIEEEKWPVAEQLESVTHEIKESEHAFMALVSEEDEVRAKIKLLNVLSAQNALRADLEKIADEKGITEAELAARRAEHDRLTQLIHDSQKKETVVMGAEHIVDTKVVGADSLYEERLLAEERHKLEAERRLAEGERWKAEDAIVSVTKSEEESVAQLKAISEKEASIKAKIAELG